MEKAFLRQSSVITNFQHLFAHYHTLSIKLRRAKFSPPFCSTLFAVRHRPFCDRGSGMTAYGSDVLSEQDTKTHLIMLKKDGRDICRVQCGLHFEVPLSWNITCFVSQTTLENLAECNHVHIYQAPQTCHEEREWGTFMRFLRDNEKVAIARSESYCFYILPPDSRATLDWAKVAYMVEEVFDSCGNKKYASSASGDTMSQTMSIVPPKVWSHSSKVQRTHITWSQKVLEKNVSDLESESTGKERALHPNLASIHPSFLENLGRAHDWIFGAVAELVDNSRDANASKLAIFIQNLRNKAGADIPVLSIVDDGCGMTYEEIQRMVSLGRKKQDRDDFHRIGRFGTGFKTGAMRLGRDALVLTQTAQTRSLALFSQSLNEGKDKVEIPIITYQRHGQSMVLDTSIQSKSLAKHNMKAIKEFSPFDKFLIGEKIANFVSGASGTQIFVWNLDRWGSSYTLEGKKGELDNNFFHLGDILTRHRQVRTRPGQVSQKVALDYSLQAYLEVIFLDPRMTIYVESSKVKSRPLAKFLSKTVIENGVIMGKHIQLTLGRCQLEWEKANCGIFLYWHGRLIEAYKRVGAMLHNTDMGRGVIGVIDVSTLMDGDNGHDFVHSNKQGFLDCEPYSLLVEWLSSRVNAYCDRHVDPLHEKHGAFCKPDKDWVQCDKCRKWRTLASGFDRKTLPLEWFCYMVPFEGTCSIPEEKQQSGVVTVSTKRYGYEGDQNSGSKDNANHDVLPSDSSQDDSEEEEEEVEPRKPLKRLRTARSKRCY